MRYKVTISQLVEAKNPRHAAHIVKGRLATIDPDRRPTARRRECMVYTFNGPGEYMVEEYPEDDRPKDYRVDLRIPTAAERVA